jgi:AAA15 family ATPase/GTPase
MIYSFGGRNFYSFRDDFEVDFRVKPQVGEREIFQQDSEGVHCNSVMGVFGANASGKTHLLQAIGFLQWFVLRSAQQKPNDPILSEMFFLFTDQPDRETSLWVEFADATNQYRYELSFDPEKVIREALSVKKSRYNLIFERVWTGKKDKEYSLKHQDFGEQAAKIPRRKNASLISTALLLENTVARKIDAAFSSCYGNLCHMGRSESHDPHFLNLLQTAEFFEENPDHFDWVNKRLANFDLGVDSIQIQKTKVMEEGKEREQALPLGVHLQGKRKYLLPLFQESRGTQALFVLLRYILPVLKSGGVAFIDEFELGLHPHMIPRLVDMFYSKKHNPNGAQLIFSCHSDYMLAHLEKYQIQLVEKEDDGASWTYRLDEIKGVRNVDNHYAKYHAGAYGGVPDF